MTATLAHVCGGDPGTPPEAALTIRPQVGNDPARLAAWRKAQEDKLGTTGRSHTLWQTVNWGPTVEPKAPPKARAPRPAPKPAPAFIGRPPKPDSAAKYATWRARHEAGEPASAIARDLGLHPSSVIYGIERAGGTVIPANAPRPIDEAAAIAAYRDGSTLERIARSQRVATNRVRDVLVAAGFTITRVDPALLRHNLNPVWLDPVFVARVNALLDAGKSQVATAREVGVSVQQVTRHVARRRKGEA